MVQSPCWKAHGSSASEQTHHYNWASLSITTFTRTHNLPASCATWIQSMLSHTFYEPIHAFPSILWTNAILPTQLHLSLPISIWSHFHTETCTHFCSLLCMPHAPPEMFTDLRIMHSVWIVRHCRLLWSTTIFIIIHVLLTAHAFRCLCVRHHQPFFTLWQQQVRRRQWYWRKYERPNTFCRKQSMNYYNGSCTVLQCKLLKKLIMLFSPDSFQFLSPIPCIIFFTNLSLYSFLKRETKLQAYRILILYLEEVLLAQHEYV